MIKEETHTSPKKGPVDAIEIYMNIQQKIQEANGEHELYLLTRNSIRVGASLLPIRCNYLQIASMKALASKKYQAKHPNMDLQSDGSYVISLDTSYSRIVAQPKEVELALTEYKNILASEVLGSLRQLDMLIFRTLIDTHVIARGHDGIRDAFLRDFKQQIRV